MKSTMHELDSAPVSEGFRKTLFSAAKKRWVGGVIIGYLVILAVPASFFFEFPRWIGAIVAALLSVSSTLLRGWSDSIRGDAEKLHRANQLCRGIGHPIEPAMIAKFQYRYSHLAKSAKEHDTKQVEYYESSGDPSPHLLISMLRESAWWTARLAEKAKNVIYMGAAVGLLISLAIFLSDSTAVQFYGVAICAVVLTDLFYLGYRYGKLHLGSDAAFRKFDSLLGTNISEGKAIVAATNYHVVCGTGPLVPDLLWKRQQKKLQDAWVPLSKSGR